MENLLQLQEKCWLWARAIDANGYGVIGWSENRKPKRFYVHRVVYDSLVGPIPEGLQLDHLCRVRHCINPSHLEPVTCLINTKRGANPKMVAHKNGTCVKGHDKSNFYIRKNGKTAYCKICKLDRLKERAAARGNWNFNGRKGKQNESK